MVANIHWFRMPSLPKPEYELGKALADKYGLKTDNDSPNWTELFAVALRLMHEVSLYGSDSNGQGEQWITNVINEWKKTPTGLRRYNMPSQPE